MSSSYKHTSLASYSEIFRVLKIKNKKRGKKDLCSNRLLVGYLHDEEEPKSLDDSQDGKRI
jgi:hypothetical protein